MNCRCSGVRPVRLVLLLAVLAQVPVAFADSSAADPMPSSSTELDSASALSPTSEDADEFLDRAWLASAETERGLRLSLYPSDEDVFLGWRFEF